MENGREMGNIEKQMEIFAPKSVMSEIKKIHWKGFITEDDNLWTW